MTAKQQIQQKLEKVYALYPQERARIEEVVQRIWEMDRWMVHKAFENALQKIIDAKTPFEAKRQIDTLEYVLVTSPSFTFMNKMDKFLKRYLNKPVKVLLIIALIFLLLSIALLIFEQ